MCTPAQCRHHENAAGTADPAGAQQSCTFLQLPHSSGPTRELRRADSFGLRTIPPSARALYLARDRMDARRLEEEMATSGFALLNAWILASTSARSAPSPVRIAIA